MEQLKAGGLRGLQRNRRDPNNIAFRGIIAWTMTSSMSAPAQKPFVTQPAQSVRCPKFPERVEGRKAST
jgi:hypothetical protein